MVRSKLQGLINALLMASVFLIGFVGCTNVQPSGAQYASLLQDVVLPDITYDDMLVVDILEDIVGRGNEQLVKQGSYPLGLSATGNGVFSFRTIRLNECSVYDALKKVSSTIGYHVNVDVRICVGPKEDSVSNAKYENLVREGVHKVVLSGRSYTNQYASVIIKELWRDANARLEDRNGVVLGVVSPDGLNSRRVSIELPALSIISAFERVAECLDLPLSFDGEVFWLGGRDGFGEHDTDELN